MSKLLDLKQYRIVISRKNILGEDLIMFWGTKQGVSTLMGYWKL